jgi:UDP-N-acetyl-D-galactosamine dehydrogenase
VWGRSSAADAVVVAVAHKQFVDMPLEKLAAKAVQGGSLIDVKSRYDRSALERLGLRVWRL